MWQSPQVLNTQQMGALMSVILLWIVPESSTMVPVIGVRFPRRPMQSRLSVARGTVVSHGRNLAHWERTPFTGCGSTSHSSMLTVTAHTVAVKSGRVRSAC
jgi:hypothetical protein